MCQNKFVIFQTTFQCSITQRSKLFEMMGVRQIENANQRISHAWRQNAAAPHIRTKRIYYLTRASTQNKRTQCATKCAVNLFKVFSAVASIGYYANAVEPNSTRCHTHMKTHLLPNKEKRASLN